jgi:4-hydroxy-3-methylbut-2-en-1-yl diphosphate synthase IspG/GcpE
MSGSELAESSCLADVSAWKTRYRGVEALNVAVMGCIVNALALARAAPIEGRERLR